MNKKKLESVMKLFDDTGQTLAEYLGIARPPFSNKLNETRVYAGRNTNDEGEI